MNIIDRSTPLLGSPLAPLQAVYDGPIPPHERRAALAGKPLAEPRLESRAGLGQRRHHLLRCLRRLRQAVRLDRSLRGRGEG